MDLASFTQANTWLLEYVYECVWTFYDTSNDVPLALRFLIDGCLQFESDNLLQSNSPTVQKMLCVLKCLLLAINADDVDETVDPDADSCIEELLEQFSLLSQVNDDIHGAIAHHAIASYVVDRRFHKASSCLTKFSRYLPASVQSELMAAVKDEAQLKDPPAIHVLQNQIVRHLRQHYAPALLLGDGLGLDKNQKNNENKNEEKGGDDKTAQSSENLGISFLIKTAKSFSLANSRITTKTTSASAEDGVKECKGKLGKDGKRKGKRKSTEEVEEEERSNGETDSGPTKAKLRKDVYEGKEYLSDSRKKGEEDANQLVGERGVAEENGAEGDENGPKTSDGMPSVDDEAALGSCARVRSRRGSGGRTEPSRVNGGRDDEIVLDSSDLNGKIPAPSDLAKQIQDTSELITVDAESDLESTENSFRQTFEQNPSGFRTNDDDLRPPRASTPSCSPNEKKDEQALVSPPSSLVRPPLRSPPPLPTTRDEDDVEASTQVTNDLPFFQGSYMKSLMNCIGFSAKMTNSTTTTTTNSTSKANSVEESQSPKIAEKTLELSKEKGSNKDIFTRKLVEQSRRSNGSCDAIEKKDENEQDEEKNKNTNTASDEISKKNAHSVSKETTPTEGVSAATTSVPVQDCAKSCQDAAVTEGNEDNAKVSNGESSGNEPIKTWKSKLVTAVESSAGPSEESVVHLSQLDSPIFRNDKFIRKNRGKKSKSREKPPGDPYANGGERRRGRNAESKDEDAAGPSKVESRKKGGEKDQSSEDDDVIPRSSRQRRRTARVSESESENDDEGKRSRKESGERLDRPNAIAGTVKKNSKPKDDILVIVDEDVDDDDDDDVDQDPPGASGANQKSDHPIDKKELKTRASLLHPIPPQSGAEAGKRHQWTYEESVNIWKGVQKYGEGNWSKIMESYKFHSSRTNVGVKDRWRTMVKTNLDDKIARDMKK